MMSQEDVISIQGNRNWWVSYVIGIADHSLAVLDNEAEVGVAASEC